MTVTIDLGPELATELRDEAAKEGLDPHGLILYALKEHLHRNRQGAPHLSRAEAALLETINFRWPAEVQKHFDRLVSRRRANKLTSEELAELIAMTDESEKQTVNRVHAVAELGQLRGLSFDAMWDQLGINP